MTNAEVKKALKEHEGRMILKFNTCLILMKNIESVVKNATDVCRDVYHLNKPTDETVEIKDDDSDQEDEENDNTPSVTVTKEDIQDLRRKRKKQSLWDCEINGALPVVGGGTMSL